MRVLNHASFWTFSALAQRLTKLPILMVTCNDPYAQENDALENAIVAHGGTPPIRVRLNTGHAYSDQRPALAGAVIGWLQKLRQLPAASKVEETMLKSIPVLLILLAFAVIAIPARAQMGGGGSGAGAGIPLGSAGSHDDDKDKPDKTSLTERPVSGVVTDADGNPIAGAVVQLKNARTQKTLSIITREKGEYQFSGLSKDVDYQLTATSKDHSSAPHTLSMYDSRAKPVVNLQIK